MSEPLLVVSQNEVGALLRILLTVINVAPQMYGGVYTRRTNWGYYLVQYIHPSNDWYCITSSLLYNSKQLSK